MDRDLVFAKTPLGDEAVQQRARLVQRNLRNLLIVVDGRSSVEELSRKIGNPALAESALAELEAGGYIAVSGRRVPEEGGGAVAAGGEVEAAPPEAAAVEPPAKGQPIKTEAADPFAPEAALMPFNAVPAAGQAPAEEAVEIKPIRRGPRRRLSIYQGAAIGVTVVAAVVAAGVLLFPFGIFRADIEAALTRVIGQPVTIAAVRGRFSPEPALVLEQVGIGPAGGIVVAEVVAAPRLGSLLASPIVFHRVEIVAAKLPVGQLVGLFPGLARLAGNDSFAFGRVSLSQAEIRAADLVLANYSGEIVLAEDGKGMRLTLGNADKTLHLDVADGVGALTFALEATNWRPAEGSSLVWDLLTIQGALSGNSLSGAKLDGRVLDGVVRGPMSVDWGRDVKLRGELAVEHLAAAKVAAALGLGLGLDGDIDGHLRFASQAESWSGLRANSAGDAEFVLRHGSVGGFDLVEAVRRGGREAVRGGDTHFDQLSGKVAWGGAAVRLTNLNGVSGGVERTTGSLTVGADEKLSGGFQVQLKGSVADVRQPVSVSGTLRYPELRGGQR